MLSIVSFTDDTERVKALAAVEAAGANVFTIRGFVISIDTTPSKRPAGKRARLGPDGAAHDRTGPTLLRRCVVVLEIYRRPLAHQSQMLPITR